MADDGSDTEPSTPAKHKRPSTFQDYDGRGSKVQHTNKGDLVMCANHGGGGRESHSWLTHQFAQKPFAPNCTASTSSRR